MRLKSAGSLVRAQPGPAFAWSATESEGCHARSETEAGLRLNHFRDAPRLRPGRPANETFFYVYILVSEADASQHYTGITENLAGRLKEHNQGVCKYTAKHRPWRIDTAVAFGSETKARAFERYLKSGSGREFARRHF